MGRQLVLALLLVAFLATVAPHCCISVLQVSMARSAFSSCFVGTFRLEAQPRTLTHLSPFSINRLAPHCHEKTLGSTVSG